MAKIIQFSNSASNVMAGVKLEEVLDELLSKGAHETAANFIRRSLRGFPGAIDSGSGEMREYMETMLLVLEKNHEERKAIRCQPDLFGDDYGAIYFARQQERRQEASWQTRRFSVKSQR